MPEKYKNKYRIKSARLEGYDYSNAGLYFVTICTFNREHYFGEIINNKMELTNVGVIADLLWYEIKNHSKNIKLHQFVVMPNHIHGIIEILDGGDNIKTDADTVETMHASSLHPTASSQHPTASSNPKQSSNPILTTASSKKMESPSPSKKQQMSNISPKSGTLGRIIGSYKSAVTRNVHRLGFDFNWQSRFYDHIIRNNKDYQRISDYIKNNPYQWMEDRFF